MKIAALLSSFRVQNYYKNYYKKSTYANEYGEKSFFRRFFCDFFCTCLKIVVPLHLVVAKSINDEENILDDGTVPSGHEC